MPSAAILPVEPALRLLPVEMFPADFAIQFNLACYECVLGNISQGRLHLPDALNLAHHQKTIGKSGCWGMKI
jgi:hypothetical protein